MPANLTPAQIETFKLKRKALLDELHSDEHYENTETITYGDHDPFNIPMVKCDFCGSQGKVESVQQDNGKIKFSVRCTGCGNAHQTVTPSGQQAILRWNAINPKGLRYVDFPMFGLSNLTPQDAKTRMIGIRRNLEVRENLAALESTLNPVLGKRPPGKEYRKRLKMYVQWALWALTAIKTELEQ